ncbi:TPR repeat-containing protein [Pyrenophora tritici-repentis Pt-1C-BFP]|uniref:TPR repeat-containing protein n=1 Tax=Pyrenophora tritici-repentis (strain Pt-1C-BFP) TaxID=426418 RepID=B2W3H3_PYRTR|nr:TPR repeat-containing protein [Pyrenophora tritici-repentis Pt-1C-BFP]EDU47930.1 TPR repeat-containing protein [Pyrenophora tritici-repentis Pt-1C-BFP]
MADVFLTFFRSTLPDDLAAVLETALQATETGDFLKVLQLPETQILLGHQENEATKNVKSSDFGLWSDYIFHRLGLLLSKKSEEEASTPIQETAAYRQHLYFLVAVAALHAFLQSNVTGPPLPFKAAEVALPQDVASDTKAVSKTRAELVASLSTDGVAAYKLTPNIELLCLAQTILISPPIAKNVAASAWTKLRVNFIHQRLLSEPAPKLQDAIYEDVKVVEDLIMNSAKKEEIKELYTSFLLERAAIHTHHGLDKKARADLEQATSERKFEFALTGLMGKRTKFQTKDTSQLIVLARSAGSDTNGTTDGVSQPKALDLNDDTLLESISFTNNTASMDIKDESALPASLTSMDPSNQPLLDPLDSVIMLSLAESIKNTNPADGITREQTEPRIEGYKSRTLERGLLQLQALVDQVIAETSGDATTDAETGEKITAFLPAAKEGESAPVQERLRYVFPLCSPSRWELEAELAARWVSLGGLRSALEIYERLEMWAEAALCYAATEKEDRARKMIRRQLFHAINGDEETVDLDEEKWEGAERDPPPAEAPRYYCILGDLDNDLAMYEKAWEVSGKRYARAQRSLGPKIYRRPQLRESRRSVFSLPQNQLLVPAGLPKTTENEDGVVEETRVSNHPRTDALKAFKRAATIKHDDYRIWNNVLAVAASTNPPSWSDVITSQRRIAELRGATDGEKCVDAEIVDMLVKHVVSLEGGFDITRPGLARMVNDLLERVIKPLITFSPKLWIILATLYTHTRRPGSALECHEKAWRAVTSQPKWESGSEQVWNAVVDMTIDLVDAYETLGPRDRTEGLGAGSGELVAKDWKFKSRSAVRSVIGKGKENWEDSAGWEKLVERLEELKAYIPRLQQSLSRCIIEEVFPFPT